jgi:uncharacterized iron-regulated protein
MRARAVAAIVALFGFLASAAAAEPATCESLGSSPRDTRWQREQPSHPLLGLVLKGDRPITIADNTCKRSPLQQLIVEVWDVIGGGGVVLMGEVHDNPEHHAVRADILRSHLERLAAGDGPRPAVVFEHIRATQQAQLDSFADRAAAGRQPGDAKQLLNELGWKDTGWPAAEIFYPLFDAVLQAKMPILPGNADREHMRALVRGSLATADPKDKTRLEIANALPQPLLEALTVELGQSHCGALPGSAFAAMSLAQRYTDAHLADVLVAGAIKNGGAFLLAGNGHVRTDRGVPWYVHRLAPQMQVVSVTLLEAEAGATDPEAYLPHGPDGKVASDYTLFTPRHPRPDPCVEMHKQFQPRKQ